MKQQFDKNAFKIRLDFYLKLWTKVGSYTIVNSGEEEANRLLHTFWSAGIFTMWQNRYSDLKVIDGIDNPEHFQIFCDYLGTAVNIINKKILDIYNMTDKSNIQKTIAMHVAIDEHLEEIANEVEEMINDFTPFVTKR
jgi:hypothetical protein